MVALKQQWQVQRQQRYQDAAQRRQQVRQTLAAIQQERQARTLRLRRDLDAFQARLHQDCQDRHQRQQQFRRRLHQETQQFLVSAGQQRQTMAQEMAQTLEEYVASLQANTAQFLALTAAERSLMAQQIHRDLRQFHADLTEAIAALRHALQGEVQVLRSAVQNNLATHQQQRCLMKAQMTRDLALFLKTLRSDVQSYLWELELVRKDQAYQLRQRLNQSQRDRAQTLAMLTQDWAKLRRDLQQYRQSLRSQVWGEQAPTLSSALDAVIPSVAIPVIPPSGPVIEPPSIEKQVYSYLHNVRGAKLSEIELALGINRVQTVDALKVLIQKGLISQRDRVYHTQEEAVL